MKKQFLLLAFFSLAILAGTNTAWGQMRPSNVAPTPLDPANCAPSPLNPMPGIPFRYAVDNPNGVAAAASYTWWVTKNPNFIDLTTFLSDTTDMLYAPRVDELLATDADYGIFQGADTSMHITWSANILAATDYQGTPSVSATPAAPSPTFVVVQADGTCNNNLQVFEINPMPAFTLDIANIDPADTTNTIAIGTGVSQCVDIVRSAVYTPGATPSIVMDYGKDTMLFEVIAANYVTNWIPTFELAGITGSQTAMIGWSYTKPGAYDGSGFIQAEQAITPGTPITGTTALVPGAGVNTSEGTSIYVRIIVDNNTYESIALQTLQLFVDGEDASGQWDIDQASASCDATGADQTDVANHDVTPRPDITDVTNDSNVTPDNTFINSPRN